ncbi:uncharacterized protein [Physcomitrium patens]|uniref:Uncharacterized protein n=1 Tax=Physcomitrium patens TaxID=3218 RepID=A9S7G0_PHYPA|nr:uncharacterized protein LOC112278474 [Physcomitrium patens]PNR26337.1 hypothetical protein PHYPA_030912 [Physcomitrium patens]|eukprot:XP_024367793.1 uncharacterized protein LOC112278474 [Physcomitrella patens]
MAPGSSVYVHNVMKEKEGNGKENNPQEVINSSNAGLLTSRDVNRMGNIDSNQQSLPVLSKNMLPPPKKRHHLATCQPAPKVLHTDCKENRSDRGGSLTSRISSLSPGTKRKILGYAADGSIPPLPPRQKRVKILTKLGNGKGKLCTKFSRTSEPSGLLGDLKPGIMRKPTRTRTEVHALLSAVVGDLINRDTLSAVEDFCYEIQASDEFPDQLEEPPVECSGSRNSSEEGVEHPEGPALQESLDAHIDFPEPVCEQKGAENQSKCAEVDDGPFDTGLHTRKGLISTHERTSGFVPFQRNGRHACNRTSPIFPTVSRLQTADLRDPTGYNQQAQLPLNMKQELDITLISSREACTVEGTECKQEDLEEDTCKYPLDFSSLSEGVGSLAHEDGALLQQQDSKLLVSVAAANVATCWLELLSLDVKGRLAALKSSKRRVGRVIVSGELDLDAPLLPGGAIPPPILSPGDGQPLVDNWRKVFESMDRALTMEGQKLESWLQQIHVMQSECQRDMTLSSNIRSTTFSEPTPPRTQEFQQVAVPLGVASVMSSRSSVS